MDPRSQGDFGKGGLPSIYLGFSVHVAGLWFYLYSECSLWFVLPAQVRLCGQVMGSAFKSTNELRGTALSYMYYLRPSPYKCFMLLLFLHMSHHSHCSRTRISVFYAGSDR